MLLDTDLQLWQIYENQGWPSRYLFNQELRLFEVHFGEGGYHETEAAIQELLGIEAEPVAYLHPEDDPDARIVVPTPDVEGPYSGPYEAGAVWAVLEGEGTITVNGEERSVDYTGAHLLVDHGRHEAAVLELELGDGVTCHAVCFTPGLAPDAAAPKPRPRRRRSAHEVVVGQQPQELRRAGVLDEDRAAGPVGAARCRRPG